MNLNNQIAYAVSGEQKFARAQRSAQVSSTDLLVQNCLLFTSAAGTYRLLTSYQLLTFQLSTDIETVSVCLSFITHVCCDKTVKASFIQLLLKGRWIRIEFVMGRLMTKFKPDRAENSKLDGLIENLKPRVFYFAELCLRNSAKQNVSHNMGCKMYSLLSPLLLLQVAHL